MGEIVASMELENAVDREVVRQGLRDESTVRRTAVDGVADTGSFMLMLPENVVSRLGLRTLRQVVVTYADERATLSRGARGACPSHGALSRGARGARPSQGALSRGARGACPSQGALSRGARGACPSHGKETRQVAGPVTVQIANRSMITDCIVGPPSSEPLIGRIVMAVLDLVADSANRTLAPRRSLWTVRC